MYEAHIEANMPDDDTADFLSEDLDWLEGQWPECTRQATDAGKNVVGDPVLYNYTKVRETGDGNIYDFRFDVPTTN